MFDFEKLVVYQKAKEFHLANDEILKAPIIKTTARQQLHRASLSVILNLAEGSGRFTKKDRKNFYIISRSSVFECIAVLDVLQNSELISAESYNLQYQKGEELSRIILALIKALDG